MSPSHLLARERFSSIVRHLTPRVNLLPPPPSLSRRRTGDDASCFRPSRVSSVRSRFAKSFYSLAEGGLIFTASSMLVFLAGENLLSHSPEWRDAVCDLAADSLSSSRELNFVFGSTMSVSTSYRVRASRGDIRHLLKEGGKWL